jgi:hypothetical protein
MKTAHTAGPWEIHHAYRDNQPFRVTDKETGESWTAFSQTIGKGDLVIADVTAYWDESNPKTMGYTRQKSQAAAIADARLIAAAPELLEALQNLEDAATLVIERWERGDLADAVRSLLVDRDNARAVILKATGAA